MEANRLERCPSDSLLTLSTCLQCSENDRGGAHVLRDV